MVAQQAAQTLDAVVVDQAARAERVVPIEVIRGRQSRPRAREIRANPYRLLMAVQQQNGSESKPTKGGWLMAIISKNVQSTSRAGLAATYNSGLTTTDTYTVANDGKTFLHFKKTGAGICTVTVVVNSIVDGIQVPNRTIAVPATTGDLMVGPFPKGVYGDPISFTLSEVTGLTFAVVRIGS